MSSNSSSDQDEQNRSRPNLADTVIERLEVNHGDHSKISSIEGIRGFAVFTVCLAHYTGLMTPWIDAGRFGEELYELLHFYGNFGVEMFFVVSGYLIYGGVIKSGFSTTDYLRKRFTRIYPTFLAVFALYVILNMAIPSMSKLPDGAWNSLVYIFQNLILLPGMVDIPPLIVVAWSISYEMFFYLTMPLMVWVLAFRKWSNLSRIIFLSAAMIAYWGTCLAFDFGISRLSAFGLGLLAYELRDHLRKYQLPAWVGFSAVIGTVGFSYAMISGLISFKINYVICTTLVFVFFLFSGFARNALSRLLSLKYLRWFGNMSYSYFLFHGLTVRTLFALLPKFITPQGDAVWIYFVLLPLFFAATLVPTLLLYLLVEYPYSLAKMAHRPAKPATVAVRV